MKYEFSDEAKLRLVFLTLPSYNFFTLNLRKLGKKVEDDRERRYWSHPYQDELRKKYNSRIIDEFKNHGMMINLGWGKSCYVIKAENLPTLRSIVQTDLTKVKNKIKSKLASYDGKYSEEIKKKKKRYGDIFDHLQLTVLKVAMNEDVLNAMLLKAFNTVQKIKKLKRRKAKKRWKNKLVGIIEKINKMTPLKLKRRVNPMKSSESFKEFKEEVIE